MKILESNPMLFPIYNSKCICCLEIADTCLYYVTLTPNTTVSSTTVPFAMVPVMQGFEITTACVPKSKQMHA